jgi:hypothetical protein
LVSSVIRSKKLFIELNEHVDCTRVGFDGVHEGLGTRVGTKKGRMF